MASPSFKLGLFIALWINVFMEAIFYLGRFVFYSRILYNYRYEQIKSVLIIAPTAIEKCTLANSCVGQ